MSKLLQFLVFVFISIFISSCSLAGKDEGEKVINTIISKYYAETTPYSNVEPKNNEPKARFTAIQIGSSEFNPNMLNIYDAYHKAPNGKILQYRFGPKGDYNPPSVSELQGMKLPSDYVKAVTQINIVPDKLFVFSTGALKSEYIKGNMFRSDRIESIMCKWHFEKMAFMPKAGHDYLLSYGAKLTEENKFMCILKLQEWDKKSKQYIDVPFAPYAKLINSIN